MIEMERRGEKRRGEKRREEKSRKEELSYDTRSKNEK